MPGEEKGWWEEYLEKRKKDWEAEEKKDEGGVILTEQEAKDEGLFD